MVKNKMKMLKTNPPVNEENVYKYVCFRSINLLCTVALPTVHKILWACSKIDLSHIIRWCKVSYFVTNTIFALKCQMLEQDSTKTNIIAASFH